MAFDDPDRTARDGAMAFAQGMAAAWHAALGAELLGVYLIGSLAHGGFNRRYSDVDMAVTAENGLTPQLIDRVRAEATARSSDWGPKLSVFWSDRQFSIGRFPPLDRLDYLDRPVVLMERERLHPPRPSLEEIRRYLSGPPFASFAANARRLAAAATLEPKERKAYLRALLYPARFCYSFITGRMASNDEAAAFLHGNAPPGLDIASIDAALQCRRAAADPDSLFYLRRHLPAQVEACAALLSDHAIKDARS